jgi:hypothetical protein
VAGRDDQGGTVVALAGPAAAAAESGHWMHVEGLVLPGLLMLLAITPMSCCRRRPHPSICSTTLLRCSLPYLLLLVSSLSPSINLFEIPFLFYHVE